MDQEELQKARGRLHRWRNRAARTPHAITAGRATGQTWTFSGSGSSLTLTGADGSTQTITIADMAAGATQALNFDQLGIKLTISSAAGTKAGADLVADLTAAGHNTLVTASLFAPPQTTSDFYAGLVGKIGTANITAICLLLTVGVAAKSARVSPG